MRVIGLVLLALFGSSGVASAHPVATLIGTLHKNGPVDHKLISNCKQGQRTVYLQGGSSLLDRFRPG